MRAARLLAAALLVLPASAAQAACLKANADDQIAEGKLDVDRGSACRTTG